MYIRRFNLPEMLGVSLSTIDRWVRDGVLPQPVKLGVRTTAFRLSDIQDWLETR